MFSITLDAGAGAMEDKALVAGARVDSRILERIQALVRSSDGGDFRCVGAAPGPAGTREAEEGPKRRLNVWRVNHRMVVFGQCWDNSTESIARRNNTDELVRFLESSYGDRCMVWCFSEGLGRSWGAQKIESLDFDLGAAYKVACAVKCWLDFSPNNMAAFEMRNGDEDKLRFLLGCVLRHCRLTDRAEQEDKGLEDVFASGVPNANTVRRYIKYFDSASTPKHDNAGHDVILRQLIMTTIPEGRAEAFSVGMRIRRKGEDLCAIREDDGGDRVYRDDDYAVFSEIDCSVSEDIQILVSYHAGGSEEKVALLRINPFFYRQGLYRFSLDDMECLLPRSRFDKDFTIDLVMAESGRAARKPLCFHSVDLVQGLRMLNEGFWRDPDRGIYEGLVADGRSEIVAKFCAFMGFCPERANSFIRDLGARGVRTDSFETGGFKYVDMEFGSSEKACSKDDVSVPETGPCADAVAPARPAIDRKALYSAQGVPPKRLEPIKGSFGVERALRPKPKKVVVRKRAAEGGDVQPAVVIRKPLHWVPLARTEDTIFSEMSGISTEIDYEKFEEMFCESASGQQGSEHKAPRGVIGDSRLFLVSLALKHLEMRGIMPENVRSMVVSPSSSLELQDLLNIEKMYPDGSEVMGLISAPPEALGRVERAMLAYSRLLDVRKLAEILAFERRFSDEIFGMEETLCKLLGLYNRILDSLGLRMVLKAILEIGNTMNFRYSMNKRRVSGFKLSSLYVFNNYRGKNNVSLFPFLFQMLETNGVRAETLFAELEAVHGLKGEEHPRICERINGFIEMYTEKLELLEQLDEGARDGYVGFFGFAYKKLEELGAAFRESHLHSSMIKHKLGEDESKDMKEVLTTLSDFLHTMEQQYRMHKPGNDPAPRHAQDT